MTWSGRKVATARVYWRARLPLPCYRCHRPVLPGQRWQVEHMEPRAAGGRIDRSNEWVSHGHCNESHGGRLGAAMRNARRPQTMTRMESEKARGIRGW